MWPLVTPSRQRAAARHTPVRRPRRHRPHCTPLEDRCLLSVSLTETAPAVPYVGSPVVWTATSSGHGRSPVYQFSVGPQGGPLQVVQDFSTIDSFTWNPMQQGTYDIQVVVKHGYQRLEERVHERDVYGADACRGGQRRGQPHGQPPGRPVQRPPPPAPRCTSSSPSRAPPRPGRIPPRCPSSPARAPTSSWPACCPNTTYLMRYVLDDGTVSAPLAFTTGSLPANLNFPTFTVVQPPAAGTDLSEGVLFHAGTRQHRRHRGDRPERQRHLVL